jgi:hypothetical protein
MKIMFRTYLQNVKMRYVERCILLVYAANDRELNIQSPTHLTLRILEVIFPALLEYVGVISRFIRVVVIWNIIRVLRPLYLFRTSFFSDPSV